MISEPVELLKELIRIPSVNPMGRDLAGPEYFETRLTEYLSQWFRELGVEWHVQEVAPGRCNLLALSRNPNASRTVLLDAHQDTVPVDGMTIAPFSALERDGRIHGRGACDVKGGLAAMLSAFARIVREAPSGAANVLMSCTIDEESTALGVKALADWLVSDDCPVPRPDVAVIAEPTELDVVVAHRGAVRWTIRTRGRACHSSRPEEGENAIYRMGEVLGRLAAYAERLPQLRPPHPLCGGSTCSVGRIGGGASVNTVPDDCWIEIDRRIIPGEEGADARGEVIAELESLPFPVQHDEPWIVGFALSDDENQSLSSALLDAIARTVGPRRAVGVSYGTHASRTARAGIPSVVFGPGNIAQAHTEDEWIEIEQLRQAAEVYYEFCRTAGAG
jgi:succinyl-diaminopimelate desuccinylase